MIFLIAEFGGRLVDTDDPTNSHVFDAGFDCFCEGVERHSQQLVVCW